MTHCEVHHGQGARPLMATMMAAGRGDNVIYLSVGVRNVRCGTYINTLNNHLVINIRRK